MKFLKSKKVVGALLGLVAAGLSVGAGIDVGELSGVATEVVCQAVGCQ
ncbi:hypothetical protein [Klebsiella phage pKP-M186-2.1]|nr:hypothetical protein [Klebsiella phage pKP-M186-2.1]